MKYELQNLDSLIHHTLNAKNVSAIKLTEKQTREFFESIYAETERIKTNIIQSVCNAKDATAISLFIQNHQKLLVDLADEVNASLRNQQLKNAHPIYEKTLDHLIDLLHFLEKHFNKYIDPSYKIADATFAEAAENIKHKLHSLEKKLRAKNIDPEFVNLISNTFETFIKVNINKQQVTYGRREFMLELMQEFQRIASEKFQNDIDYNEKIISSLCYLNLNSMKVYNYCVKRIGEKINSLDSVNSQLEHLNSLFHYFKYMRPKDGYSYHPERKSIATMVSKWIKGEIRIIEKQYPLPALDSAGDKSPGLNPYFKIKTNLSVSELAGFNWLFVKTKVFNVENKTELLQFMSRYVGTKQKPNEDLSPGSMYGKFYKMTYPTAVSLKTILIDMINALNEKIDSGDFK